MNRMLAIYNGRNKKFRHDGDEFQREALGWSKAQPEPVELVDVRDGKIRAEIRKMTDGLDVLAIFDHGTPKGLPRMRESYRNVKGLAETIAGVTDRITVVLYACSCGRGWWWNPARNTGTVECSAWEYSPKDGYAFALGCELTKLHVDIEIYAHTTAGHTTRNPNLVFIGDERYKTSCRFGYDEAGSDMVWRDVYPRLINATWREWVAEMKTKERYLFWR